MKMRPRTDSINEAITQDRQEGLQPTDTCKLEDAPEIVASLEKDEHIIYSIELIKVNKRKLRQKRVLLLTNKNLYNLR